MDRGGSPSSWCAAEASRARDSAAVADEAFEAALQQHLTLGAILTRLVAASVGGLAAGGARRSAQAAGRHEENGRERDDQEKRGRRDSNAAAIGQGTSSGRLAPTSAV